MKVTINNPRTNLQLFFQIVISLGLLCFPVILPTPHIYFSSAWMTHLTGYICASLIIFFLCLPLFKKTVCGWESYLVSRYGALFIGILGLLIWAEGYYLATLIFAHTPITKKVTIESAYCIVNTCKGRRCYGMDWNPRMIFSLSDSAHNNYYFQYPRVACSWLKHDINLASPIQGQKALLVGTTWVLGSQFNTLITPKGTIQLPSIWRPWSLGNDDVDWQEMQKIIDAKKKSVEQIEDVAEPKILDPKTLDPDTDSVITAKNL